MATGEEIFARARTIATQMGGDANLSAVIDSKGGIRALLPHAIREIYRRKANDQKFNADIAVTKTVAIVAGSGTCPDEIMREFLNQAEFADDNGSLITYFDYGIDMNSGTNFSQLGYVTLQGSTFLYTAPKPTVSYTGNLDVTVPCTPVIPASMASDIPMSDATTEDVVLFLAEAILGKEQFKVVTTP